MRGSQSSKEVGRRPWCDGMATVLPTSTPSMDRRWVSATGSNDVWLTSCRSCDYVMFQGDLRHYDGISWSSEPQSDDMGRAPRGYWGSGAPAFSSPAIPGRSTNPAEPPRVTSRNFRYGKTRPTRLSPAKAKQRNTRIFSRFSPRLARLHHVNGI